MGAAIKVIPASAPGVKLVIRPKTKAFQDILVAAHAKHIWEARQGRILPQLEQYSGLKFKQRVIYAYSGAYNEPPHSGYPRYQAMSLPLCNRKDSGELGYYMPELEYIGAVTHEIGHHLLLEHGLVAPKGAAHDYRAHQHLYLFLLDAWEQEYGMEAAEKLIRCDCLGIKEVYGPAISWAQKLGFQGRQQVLACLREHKALPMS